MSLLIYKKSTLPEGLSSEYCYEPVMGPPMTPRSIQHVIVDNPETDISPNGGPSVKWLINWTLF